MVEERTYECSEVVTFALSRVTQPDVVVEVIHIQHKATDTVLYIQYNRKCQALFNINMLHPQQTSKLKCTIICQLIRGVTSEGRQFIQLGSEVLASCKLQKVKDGSYTKIFHIKILVLLSNQ